MAINLIKLEKKFIDLLENTTQEEFEQWLLTKKDTHSNPMAQLKLYTEEQVRNAIRLATKSPNIFTTPLIYSTDEVMEKITPIELPSDEEIDAQAHKVHNELFNEFYSYTDGAKWLRDKLYLLSS
jgi:23S rRNA maturation-related 3'-5' exoribonuclease YhaM